MNFYTVNYSKFLADLGKLEMKYLFNHLSGDKYFFSDRTVAPRRSPFIKERLSIIYEGDTLESLLKQVVENSFAAENFKVIYQKIEDGTEHYPERLRSVRELGLAINGEADIHYPKVTFGVTRVDGRWLFGEYEKNDFSWHHHDNKPHTYSNSINFRVARALVNIGIGPDTSRTLIDPCCGVGTVVIEALSMGIDAKGYEINLPVAKGAQKNLSFFGYPDTVTGGDMHTIGEHFDVAIVDIPYGLYNAITAVEQFEIIRTARRISDRMVLVTYDNMDDMVREAGFEIKDKVMLPKGRFLRYISVCE